MANKKEEIKCDRREFLKAASLAGVGLAGLFSTSLSGCATADIHSIDIAASTAGVKPKPLVYPRLSHSKIQFPDTGCLIGYSTPGSDNSGFFEITFGEKPSIVANFSQSSLSDANFPLDIVGLAGKGIIPLVYTSIGFTRLEDVVRGKIDNSLEYFAEEAAKFGVKHGGFLFTPMFEMNLPYLVWPWSGDGRHFVKAWRHIWEIFEAKGVNRYATWSIEYHVDGDIRDYWPGDKFVDCIGLSAYNRAVHHQYHGNRHLYSLIIEPYGYFRSKHPNKPIILEEFGTTIGPDQPEWLKKAYQTIKALKGIKAALYWDNVMFEINDDHRLSQESLTKMKQIFNDQYWIMAK